MVAGTRGTGWGPEYRITATFRVPLDFAFAWCTDYTPVAAARRLRGPRGDARRLVLGPRRRHAASSEPLAHGRSRESPRRRGRLPADIAPGWPDAARASLEA